MSKTILLSRRELIWETRENTWTENDWKDYLKWMEQFNKDVALDRTNQWNYAKHLEWLHIKDLTWDEVYADFQKYQHGEDSISWEVDVQGYDYDYETREYTRNVSRDYTYTQYLADIIIEAMREDNYDTDVTDTDYADDFEESFDFIEGEDND